MREKLENLLSVINQLQIENFERGQLVRSWGFLWDAYCKESRENKTGAGKFCVVGMHCGKVGRSHPRKWYDTQAEAIEHAREIVKHQITDAPWVDRSFLIAKAVLVVEREKEVLPPIVTRLPVARDF